MARNNEHDQKERHEEYQHQQSGGQANNISNDEVITARQLSDNNSAKALTFEELMSKHQAFQDTFVRESCSGSEPRYTDDAHEMDVVDPEGQDSHRVVMLIEPSKESISSHSSLDRHCK